MNEIQSVIFDIYMALKTVCEKNSLRYWAIGGTCLGAVRHKGFIPWDSDIDIAMPDSDYQEFLRIADEELKKFGYSLLKRDPGNMVARIFDPNTTYIPPANFNFPNRFYGVHLDLMPFCGMPKSAIMRKIYAFKMGFLEKMDAFRFSPADSHKGYKKMTHKFLCHFIDDDYFFKKWNKNIVRYKFDDSNYTCFLWADHHLALKLILKTEWFSDWIEVPFESSTIRCPKSFDDYLKAQYGDYMTIPSIEEREMYDAGWFLDLNTPYSYYQEHGLPDNVLDKRSLQ